MSHAESNEMATLPPSTSQTAAAEPTSSTVAPEPTSSSIPAAQATIPTPSSREEEVIKPVTSSTSPGLSRKQSEAIGAAASSDDESTAVPAKVDPEAGPTVLITLLLTTGKKHPYKIDARYLRKRNVTVDNDDPWNLPVQTLKELILRDWRDDWDERPSSPSNIRLISMGLELQEGEMLKDKRFNPTGSNIVHMVIKRELPEDEELKDAGGKATSHAERRSSNCCGCVIL